MSGTYTIKRNDWFLYFISWSWTSLFLKLTNKKIQKKESALWVNNPLWLVKIRRTMIIEFYACLLWRFVINFMWLEWQNESYLINTKRTILKLNKRVLTTGPLMPGYLYWNYPVITSVRSVEKAYHTSDFSLTSYHLESKNFATLKYKKGHNSGKDCRKIVIIELDLDTPTYNT